MFADRLREKICGWLSAMSVKLPLSVELGSWPHLLTKHTRLSRGLAYETKQNLTNATVVNSSNDTHFSASLALDNHAQD